MSMQSTLEKMKEFLINSSSGGQSSPLDASNNSALASTLLAEVQAAIAAEQQAEGSTPPPTPPLEHSGDGGTTGGRLGQSVRLAGGGAAAAAAAAAAGSDQASLKKSQRRRKPTVIDSQRAPTSGAGTGGAAGTALSSSAFGSGGVPSSSAHHHARSKSGQSDTPGLGDTALSVDLQPAAEEETDEAVATWLNADFADADERKDTGFDLAIPEASAEDFRPPVVINKKGGSEQQVSDSTSSGRDPASASTMALSVSHRSGGPAGATAVQQQATSGSAEKEQQEADAADRPARGLVENSSKRPILYSRTHSRKTDARATETRWRKLAQDAGVEFLDSINSPDFDIFQIYDEYRRSTTPVEATTKTFVTVCANVLFSYSFVQRLDFDIPKLIAFLHEAEKLYGTNPYHNATHAADVMQTTHVYLCTNDVNQYFSDPELFAVLFGAMCHDIGHLGVNNAFLQNAGHPVAVLYNDSSVQESFHTSLAFAMLRAPGTDFLTGSHTWTPAVFRDFRSIVIDCIWGTDMKNHAALQQSAAGILEDNVIEDSEVQSLLRAIVHAADLSNPLKNWSTYIEWAARVVGEFWRQGDEEARRGVSISPMCDRTGANFAKAQKGFIEFVVRPWMLTLEPVLPAVWMKRLEDNLAGINSMSADEVDNVHVRISSHANTPFDDLVAKRVLESLRKMLSPPDDGALRTRNPVAVAGSGARKNSCGGAGGDALASSTKSRSQRGANLSPAATALAMSPTEVAERLREQWRDIIKGLTSRGTLTSDGAIEAWSKCLLDANRIVQFLDVPASVTDALMQAAASVRSVLEKMKPQEFRDQFAFVRTLNLALLDMVRPVAGHTPNNSPIKPSSTSPQKHINLSPQQRNSLSQTIGLSSSLSGGSSSYAERHQRDLFSQQEVAAQQPATVVLSGDTTNVVRFFSEDRPVLVPLESKSVGMRPMPESRSPQPAS